MSNLNLVSSVSAPQVNARSQQASADHGLPKFGWLDIWLILCMIMWGANIALMKVIVGVLPTFVINGYRFLIGAAILGIAVRLQGGKLMLPRRELLTIAAVAVIGQCLYHVVWMQSLRMTTVANNTLINAAAPVWVVLYNALRGKERLSHPGMVGVLISMVGVATIILGRDSVSIGGDSLPGDLLALLTSLLWALATLLAYVYIVRNPPITAAFWAILFGGIYQSILAIPSLFQLSPESFDPSVWLALTVSGVVSIGIGHIVWYGALKQLGTGRPSIYSYLQPIAASITAVLFLSQPITVWLLAGGVLVMVGVVMVRRG